MFKTTMVRSLLAVALAAQVISGFITRSALAGPAAAPVLDLETSSGVVTDESGDVTSWTDLSGSGHNATQGNLSEEPILVANVYNGLPAIQFNGSSDFLNLSGQVLTSQQFSIFAVVTDASPSDGIHHEIISDWNGFGNGPSTVFFGTSGNIPDNVRFTDDFGTNGIGTFSSNPANPMVLSAFSNSDSVAVYQNESLVASGDSALTTRDLAEAYVIGEQGALYGEFWSGDIGAILVYDRQLTDAEQIQTIQYLESTYLNVVPEPSTLALLAAGAISLVGYGWRRRRATRTAKPLILD